MAKKIQTSARKIVGATKSVGRASRRMARSQFVVGFVDDISRSFVAALQNPLVWSGIVFAVICIASNVSDLDHGPLSPYFPKDSGKPVIEWVRNNSRKIEGLAMFTPVVLDVPSRSEFMVVGIPLLLLIAPAVPVTDYAILALLTHLMLHTRKPSTRLILIGIGSALWSVGLLLTGFGRGK